MDQILLAAIKAALASAAGVIAGCGSVYWFNRMPAQWFTPDGETPCAEVMSRDRQRISGYPWKTAFSAVFCIVYVFMALTQPLRYVIPAAATLFILFELGASDLKYRVMPREIIAMLFICGFGSIPFHSAWKMIPIGAAAGLIVTAGVWAIVKYVFKRTDENAHWDEEYGYLPGRHKDSRTAVPVMSSREIAVGAAIGMIIGPFGAAAVTAAGAAAAGVITLFRTRSYRDFKGWTQPVGPYICAAAAIYIALRIRAVMF